MVRFAKPQVSVIYTDLWRNMIMLISYDFYIKISLRFTIPVISVIFKNSAAVTNTPPGDPPTPILEKTLVSRNDF